MKISKKKWNLRDEDFGALLPFVQDDNVTDIDYNGKDVWIEDLKRGPYKADVEMDPKFVGAFARRISNVVSVNFNRDNNVLEAETDTLRISIVHEDVTATGCSISIRKTPPIQRITLESAISENYCTQEVLNFLINSVVAHMSMVACGLPGVGKTELIKFLTQFIPDYEKVITIEDNLEIHYREINPNKNSVELKVEDDIFNHTKAIKFCLRHNPKRIILSEARSEEVKFLLQQLSTGVTGFTTLHVDDARKIPERISNMVPDSLTSERLEKDAYTFLNIGVLINKVTTWNKIYRYIDQVCIFDSVEGQKIRKLIVNEGKIIDRVLPDNVIKKFKHYGISDPFATPDLLRNDAH